MRRTVVALGLAVLGGCASTPLEFPSPLPEYPREDAGQRAKLEAAWARLRDLPDSIENIVWYGRRTAYLGDYERAIDIYTRGLERFPDSAELLRHRGHRFLSIERFDAARADLQRAAEAIEGTEDAVEPDGLPNARGIPTSTLHTNIWYHLGLARYFSRDYEAAGEAFDRCASLARNRDMEVAARYWRHLVHFRQQTSKMAPSLRDVDASWDIIENTAYHRLLLLFRGDLTLDDFSEPDATTGYGLARYAIWRGDTVDGWQRLAEVARQEPRAAFGSIGARTDLTTSPSRPR